MSELSRETQELLEAGRHPPALAPAHRARLKKAIVAQVAGASIAATTTAAAWTTLGAKLVGGVVLVAATGAAVAAGTGAWQPSRGGVETAHRTTTYPAPPVESAAPVRGPVQSPSAVSSATQAVEEVPSEALAAARATARHKEPATASARVPAAVTVPSAAQAPEPQAARAPVSPLEEEVHLLRDADRAIKAGKPDAALVLLDQHAAAFPRSALEPERAAERVFALCAAGRVSEARARAAAFLAAYPLGPLAARVQRACAAR